MTTHVEYQIARRSSDWPTELIAVLLLVFSVGVAGVAYMYLNETYPTPRLVTRQWGWTGTGAAAFGVTAALAAFVSVYVRTRAVWLAAVLPAAITVAAGVLLIFDGALLIGDVTRRGGDWAGWNILATMVFAVAVPVAHALVSCAALVRLLHVRPPGRAY
jgi:hypothetical protein